MGLKHYTKKCLCCKKNKKCNMSGIIDLNRFGDKEYLKSLYKSGVLDSIYNVMQSVTQSLKSNTGTFFENIIDKILSDNKLSYSKQFKLEDGHTIDFAIPSIKHGENISDYTGVVLSLKTSLRERHLQDKYLKCDVVTITLDKPKIKKNNVIYVDTEEKNFTNWFNRINIKHKMSNKKLKVLDLFCGCGGFTQGISENKNFEVVAGIDIWDTAIKTYKRNHCHLALCKDLTIFGPELLKNEYNINDIDCIIGGPPCQGFSNAGKRDIKDPRNSLFMEFNKYIDSYKPKVFIMENVMGIMSMKNDKNEKCIDIISDILSTSYNIIISKLYASDFNVPQNRRRVLIIGVRKDLNIIPTSPKPLYEPDERPSVSSILENREDVDHKYYLSEKALNGINRKKERMLKEGKGFGAQFLKFDKPSYTIPSRYWKDGYDALVKYDDNNIRRLTIKELLRIQSFPDSYILEGNTRDIIIQIGNAVACKFAFYISQHLENILQTSQINLNTIEADLIPSCYINKYNKLNCKELKTLCKQNKLGPFSKLRKKQLITLLLTI